MNISSTIKLIKNNAKTNVTCSISRDEQGRFISMNFTGRLISCEGFISSEGINYDKELVGIDCPTTVVITNEAQANAVYERLGSIFADRLQAGDKNPAVDLRILSNGLRVTDTNILVTNVEKVFVNSNTSLANTSDRINDSLEALRKFSAAKSTITSNSLNSQLQAARGGLNATLTDLVNTAKRSVKTYL
jgi:hypothetical protein